MRADRWRSLGGRLGGVADGVEGVGALADALGLVRHLDDAARVVSDGPEDVHGEHVRGGREHSHRRHRGAE